MPFYDAHFLIRFQFHLKFTHFKIISCSWPLIESPSLPCKPLSRNCVKPVTILPPDIFRTLRRTRYIQTFVQFKKSNLNYYSCFFVIVLTGENEWCTTVNHDVVFLKALISNRVDSIWFRHQENAEVPRRRHRRPRWPRRRRRHWRQPWRWRRPRRPHRSRIELHSRWWNVRCHRCSGTVPKRTVRGARKKTIKRQRKEAAASPYTRWTRRAGRNGKSLRQGKKEKLRKPWQ